MCPEIAEPVADSENWSDAAFRCVWLGFKLFAEGLSDQILRVNTLLSTFDVYGEWVHF